MNSRERAKHKRLEFLQKQIPTDQFSNDDLVSILIINYGITKRTALEEILAVRHWISMGGQSEKIKTETTQEAPTKKED